MTALSVNVNKLALIRNSRGENLPDVLAFSRIALELGAAGITVHPRPDGRHILETDVRDLRELVRDFEGAELNVEGYPSTEFMTLINAIRPHQVTFVPDPPEALTSSFGWDVDRHHDLLKRVIQQAHDFNCRTALFVDENFNQFEALLTTQTDRIELYTGPYAQRFSGNNDDLKDLVTLAKTLSDKGIGINAGHDLNQANLAFLLKHIPQIAEVSIGHALTCDALTNGWAATIKAYLERC